MGEPIQKWQREEEEHWELGDGVGGRVGGGGQGWELNQLEVRVGRTRR